MATADRTVIVERQLSTLQRQKAQKNTDQMNIHPGQGFAREPGKRTTCRSELTRDELQCAAFNRATRVIVNDHRWQASSHRGFGSGAEGVGVAPSCRSQPAGDGLQCAAFNQATRVIVNDHRWQASSHNGSGAPASDWSAMRPPSLASHLQALKKCPLTVTGSAGFLYRGSAHPGVPFTTTGPADHNAISVEAFSFGAFGFSASTAGAAT